MVIKAFDSGLLSSNMYVIEDSNHAIVIDPARNTLPGRGLKVDLLITTHEHYDHISGVNLWKNAYSVPLLCSYNCAERITDSRKNQARYFKSFCELQTWMIIEQIPKADENYTCQADEIFKDEMSFTWLGHEFQLFELPGHSLGSIGILLDKQHFFSGDSLIEGKEIELRFPGGSKEKWEKTGAPRLALLPEGIQVYPGHFKEFVYKK